jgi:TIR domain
MAQPEYQWDLFVSYAREDKDWLRKELVEPLRAYRTADGRAVSVFVDTDALHAGFNWMEEVMSAIMKCRVLLAIYSKAYFESEPCKFEMVKGVQRDPVGLRGMFRPVAITDVGKLVPEAYTHLTWLDASDERWFNRLIDALGYRHHGRIHNLQFREEIPAATTGTPLGAVSVEVQCDGRRVEEDEVIRLISESGTLRGTSAAKSDRGLATFHDLFFDAPAESTRLVATADGCTASFSNTFAVLPPPVIKPPEEDPRIDATGEVYFFGDPEVIGIAGNDTVHVFNQACELLGSAALPNPLRLIRACAGGLVFLGWGGEIVWVGANSERREWRPGPRLGFCVPGDVVAASETATGELLVGMWSGEVWQLHADSRCTLRFLHPGGVQKIDTLEGQVFVSDLEGVLAIYCGQECLSSVKTEPTIRRLRAFPDSVVLIGEDRLYQYSIERKRLFSLPVPVKIAAAYGTGERTVAVSREGQGILLLRDAITENFFTVAGCIPVSMDAQGRFYAFRNPDGTYTLWHNRRPLLQGVAGGLAVSRGGTRVAIGDGSAVKISSMGTIRASAAGGVA